MTNLLDDENPIIGCPSWMPFQVKPSGYAKGRQFSGVPCFFNFSQIADLEKQSYAINVFWHPKNGKRV